MVSRRRRRNQAQRKKNVPAQNQLGLVRRLSNMMPATAALYRSLSRPFDEIACVPDGAMGVGCYSMKNEYLFTTGAGGSCNLLAWCPNPDSVVFQDTGSASGAPTVAGSWAQATQVATLNALYAAWRPISAGVRFNFIGPTSTDGGVVIAGLVDPNINLSAFNATSLQNAQVLFKQYRTFPLRNGGEAIWAPLDEMDMAEFKDISTVAIATSAAQQVPYIVVIVYGAAGSQGTLHCECVANFQGAYRSQTFMPGGISDKPTPSEPGWYSRAIQAFSDHPVVTEFYRGVSEVAGRGARALGAATVPYLGTLANGLRAPGLLGRTGLPRLTWRDDL